MRHLSWLWLTAIAILVAGCGTEAVTTVTAQKMPSAVHNRLAAERLAVALLDRSKLPSSAKPTSTAPSRAIAKAPQRPATANLAQATHFATASDTVPGAITFFEHHRPLGYTKNMSGILRRRRGDRSGRQASRCPGKRRRVYQRLRASAPHGLSPGGG